MKATPIPNKSQGASGGRARGGPRGRPKARLGRFGALPRDTLRPGTTQGAGGARRLRNRTLILLRWLAVITQSFLLYGMLLLRFPIHYRPCVAVVLTSALVNLFLTLFRAGRGAARPWEASAQLAFDIVQLTCLLYYTGGVTNPFSLLLIVPVSVAAATLGGRQVLALSVLTVVFIVQLTLAASPLPWISGAGVPLPLLYRAGCALALLMGLAVVTGYAFWEAREGARMELALHVTETVLAREQRLSALGALAAAAAHELGTPLATISVVAKELARETPRGPLRDDAWLMVGQAQRCRDILKGLSQTPEASDQVHERMSLLEVVREVCAPYAHKPTVRTEGLVTGPLGMAPPDLWRRPDVLHALASFAENAFDFATSEILVTGRFDARSVGVEVCDDGPGFSPEMLIRLGEPYVTSRPKAEGSRTGHIGMGLGFFIAKTLLERTGAEVDFGNAERGGAVVVARWPRDRMEAVDPFGEYRPDADGEPEAAAPEE